MSEFDVFQTYFMPRMAPVRFSSGPEDYPRVSDDLARSPDPAVQVSGRSISPRRPPRQGGEPQGMRPAADVRPLGLGAAAFQQPGDAQVAPKGRLGVDKEGATGLEDMEEADTILPEEEDLSPLAPSSCLGGSGLFDGSALSPCSVRSPPAPPGTPQHPRMGSPAVYGPGASFPSGLAASPTPGATPPAESAGAWVHPTFNVSPLTPSPDCLLSTPPARGPRHTPSAEPGPAASAAKGSPPHPFSLEGGGDDCRTSRRGTVADGAVTPSRSRSHPLEALPSHKCSPQPVSDDHQQVYKLPGFFDAVEGASEVLSSPRSTSRVCSPSHGSVLSPRSPPSPAVLFPGDGAQSPLAGRGSGEDLLTKLEDWDAMSHDRGGGKSPRDGLLPAPEDAAAPPPAGDESIPCLSTILYAIQSGDAEANRRDREVTIKVPEGVGADLKVRVNMHNMAEELIVPIGAQAGEVVQCDLPAVNPLSPAQQKRILLEGILMTRLRWTRMEDGEWVTDEIRKMKKHEAYRTLRGRRMGLVLAIIPEEAPEEQASG